ncbi:GOLPH3/VPS74 family protein [Yinghuangia seranimata]|uniref:GOLPH3/VPS74 family protein n=1 Tax=Yinghuangia seranimata TaxID=408067 RepID=UPI00248D00CB|nr:GPP34 family phosphoprotein [Yinghuangia seranimata]MDI2124942.1 GPP34 family phosphoprotein [Yinghuangia seranimata]
MSVSRDLMTAALEADRQRPVSQGALSLALAGAELIELLRAEAAVLDGDVILPAGVAPAGDALLNQAATAIVRVAPYERLDDWLWRRGRGLAAAYIGQFEAEGELTVEPGRMPFLAGEATLPDTDERQHVHELLASDDVVLTTLAAAAGFHDLVDDDAPGAEGTVLGAVTDAANELAAIQQRHDIEQAAFDNVWRGF